MLLKLFNAVISSKSGSGRTSGLAIRVLKSLGKAHQLEPVLYPSLEECSGTVSVTDTARTSPKGLTASRDRSAHPGPRFGARNERRDTWIGGATRQALIEDSNGL